MMRRILCPTDLTENSEDSVAYALRLAKENGAQLIVFHATTFPSLYQFSCELDAYYPWKELVSAFNVDRIVSDAKRKIKNYVSARFGAEIGEVAWKPQAALGKAAEEIVRASFQEEVDLIVMARCKRATLARIFTNSVAEAVSRAAPCPVLSIDTTQFVRRSGGWRLPLLRDLFQSS
jgi:nucleotide-binding universal stress UspA family protein